MTDPFTETLNDFCRRMSEKVAICAEENDQDGMETIVGALLDATREAIANLMLCELECERLLRHG